MRYPNIISIMRFFYNPLSHSAKPALDMSHRTCAPFLHNRDFGSAPPTTGHTANSGGKNETF